MGMAGSEHKLQGQSSRETLWFYLDQTQPKTRGTVGQSVGHDSAVPLRAPIFLPRTRPYRPPIESNIRWQPRIADLPT